MKHLSYHPFALTTIFFWSLAYVFTRLMLPYFSSASLGFLRYLTASLALAAVAVGTKMKLPPRRDWPWFLLSGFFGFFLYMLLFNRGLSMVPSSMASVVSATIPALTALLSRLLGREKLNGVQWVAIGIELVGIAVLVAMNGGLSGGIGLLWMALSAIIFSIYNIIQQKITQSYTALQSSAYSIWAGTLLLSIFAPTAFRELAAAPAPQYLYLAALGIFPSAVAFVTWAQAFARAERTTQVSNYMVLTLFMASLMAFLVSHEVPSVATLCGGGITLCGVLTFNFSAEIIQHTAKKS